jgi:two-component system, sporulation sensor kinase D
MYFKVDQIENKYKTDAEWYAHYHAMNMENFIGETVSRLEMLSTSIKFQHHNIEEIKEILIKTEAKDPRFSGFYWADVNGDLLISSNPTAKLVNVSDRKYFQDAISTGNMTISDAHIGRVTGRYIITIASPILEGSSIQGVLLASIRLDEFEEAISRLLKNEKIIVTDLNGNEIIKAGSFLPDDDQIKASINISKIPWTLTAFVSHDATQTTRKMFLLYFIEFFTIANILFLLLMYLILKKRVKNEKAQIERQKLELIGNLAASTAHEIRNPLTGIKGLVKLMSEENKDERAQFYFNVIQTEIDRISAITSELLVLGKPTAATFKTYDANMILNEIEPIIHSESNYMNVQLTINYSKVELPISCVKEQLKQVLLNLTKNALQAMPSGGGLLISLNHDSDQCFITIEDTGIGLSQEELQQVFTPFFSMKKEGTGLGLTVCKRIIDSFGGNISIESTLGEGTRVNIRLPISHVIK